VYHDALTAQPGLGQPLSLSRRRNRLGAARARRAAPGWLAALALLAFGLRALVPLGFEPASGAVALVLCHEGFPAGFFTHGARRHRMGAPRTPSPADSHCLFCNSVSPAPANALTALVLPVLPAIARLEVHAPVVRGLKRGHTPQARAPPPLV
jgi:hypothetical protein